MEEWTVDENALDKMSMADLYAYKKYTKKKVKKLKKRLDELTDGGSAGGLANKTEDLKLYYKWLKKFAAAEIEERITHLVYR